MSRRGQRKNMSVKGAEKVGEGLSNMPKRGQKKEGRDCLICL